MSNRGGTKALLVRLGVLVVLGIAGIIIALNMRSPLAISEGEVKRMIADGSLIGLPLAEAARKLQHQSPGTIDGTVIFEFDQVEGWRGGKVCVDVIGGNVTAVSYLPPGGVIEEGSDAGQTQGDGADGGDPQGQGAPTGIRAKNQTSRGGGPS